MKTTEQQVEYYRGHPPSCLSGFTVRPTILAHFGFVGHEVSGLFPNQLARNPNVFFRIHGPCGGEQFYVLAQAIRHDIDHYKTLLLADRYSLTCADCRKETSLFKSSRYGYDAEVMRVENLAYDAGSGSDTLIGGPKTAIYACTKCATDILRVEVRLEYPNNLIDDPFFAGKEHEFFSWITIVADCPTCSTENIVADVECA